VVKRIVLAAFVLIVAQCVFSSRSAAQSVDPCIQKILWYFPDPIPFGWSIAGPGQGNYSYMIGAWACIPRKGPPGETQSKCPNCANPISLSTGNTYIEQVDLKIPGLGGGLTLVRTWNSLWPSTQTTFQSGVFGPNWRSTYEERIFLGVDNSIKYSRSDGSFWSFKLGSGTSGWIVAAPANATATLSTDTSVNAYYTLTFQNGEQRRFDKNTGNLIAIIDRNGNTTTVTYDSYGRLSSVVDAASRHLNFTYSGSSSLVTGVTTDAGISLSYSYDTQGRLIQVTKPDSATLNFTYSTIQPMLIVSVTDANGKILELHTYDLASRGAYASKAGGVEAVGISYPHP
jgi:YD repeat-containing protein